MNTPKYYFYTVALIVSVFFLFGFAGKAQATHFSFSCNSLDYSNETCAPPPFSSQFCWSSDLSTGFACIDDPDDGSFIVTCSSCSFGCDDTTRFCASSPPTTTPTSPPDATSTPTPTPFVAGCSGYSTCGTCISGAPFNCGWTGSPGSSGNFCQTGTNSCPGGPNWYWFDCINNMCAAPPTTTPTITPTPAPPFAIITIQSNIGFLVDVTGASTFGGSPPYTFWEWNYGDGTTDSGPTKSDPIGHTYLTAGNKTITLNVTDSAAKIGTNSLTVTVAGPTSTPTPTPTVGPGTPTIAPPTATPSPTPPGPTSTPTPDPNVFSASVSVSKSTLANNEPTTVTVNLNGTFTRPIDLDLYCDSNSVWRDAFVSAVNSSQHIFSKKCRYTTSGSFTIRVNATDSFSPKKTASGSATVNVLRRYACETVINSNSTNCQGSSTSIIKTCTDSNIQKGCTVQDGGSYYINCTDCSELNGCNLDTNKCNLLLPTPKLGLQCTAFDLQNRCTNITSAIGDIAVDPASFVSRIMSLVLGISGGIAIILIILSGYSLMTSRDKPETLQDARQKLLGAIAGLIFIALALTILEVIGVDILQIPEFGR